MPRFVTGSNDGRLRFHVRRRRPNDDYGRKKGKDDDKFGTWGKAHGEDRTQIMLFTTEVAELTHELHHLKDEHHGHKSPMSHKASSLKHLKSIIKHGDATAIADEGEGALPDWASGWQLHVKGGREAVSGLTGSPVGEEHHHHHHHHAYKESDPPEMWKTETKPTGVFAGTITNEFTKQIVSTKISVNWWP